MSVINRRNLLSSAGSFALAGAIGNPARAAMGPNDKFDLVIKGGDVLDPSQSLRGKRDIGIRFGVIEALEADIPGRARAARARRRRQAGDAGPDRSALARLSLRLGDRHSGRRARCAPGHDHLRVGGRRRRQQFRGLPPPRRGADPHAALCLRAHRQYRARAASRCPSSTISTSRRSMPPPRRWPRTPTSCSASRCACRRT